MASLQSIEFHECAGITNAGLVSLAGLPRFCEFTVGRCPGITREGAVVFSENVQVNYWS